MAPSPAIAPYPAGLIGYADLASRLLGSLQAPIGKLNPNDPLPAALAAFAQDVFSILSQGATALSNVANAAAAQIARFSGDNAVVDAGIARRMGSAPVQGFVNNVDRAGGLVVGAWQAMSTDLSNVMSGELPITTALLLSLDIGTALASWASVRSDAAAFAAFAPTQQRLLDAGCSKASSRRGRADWGPSPAAAARATVILRCSPRSGEPAKDRPHRTVLAAILRDAGAECAAPQDDGGVCGRCHFRLV